MMFSVYTLFQLFFIIHYYEVRSKAQAVLQVIIVLAYRKITTPFFREWATGNLIYAVEI
jgi:hypothetical protein